MHTPLDYAESCYRKLLETMHKASASLEDYKIRKAELKEMFKAFRYYHSMQEVTRHLEFDKIVDADLTAKDAYASYKFNSGEVGRYSQFIVACKAVEEMRKDEALQRSTSST